MNFRSLQHVLLLLTYIKLLKINLHREKHVNNWSILNVILHVCKIVSQ